ncbi:hypothetical protein LJ753_06300 [Arthrobacter sp. zg-Y20]|uniref:WXG100 family type VII secretion target n=1 Tax=unclassified Arthrobacter TaxID=235627 RepID=UPI001D138530|nr:MULTISPECIES: hypothetical protein [unclassified Arthrobacter]MCC3275481.1 hypothetical protein [Arthrobacter sp. zg-Y20]MDK1315638.1 hypothetical protein [Arthrobacter sp. zg.Y20]WIB06051.1 hypothetical protein QNO06_16275 [Arthrobacter sp. zg-Y20]
MGAIGAADSFRDQPAFQVRGGSVGLLVQLEDLARVADRLGTTTSMLRNLEKRVNGLWLEAGAWGGGSVTADRVRARMLDASFALRRSAAALEELTEGVRESARSYAATEGRVQLRMPWAGEVSPWPAAPASGGTLVPTRGQMEAALGSVADEVALLAALALLKTAGVTELRPVTVTALPGKPENIRLDGTAAGLLARSQVLKDENDPGVVEVLRIEEGGKNTFIVVLPGTQGWFSDGGSVPFDLAGMGEARGRESQYVAAAVAEALRQANAEAGDSVVLSGYSQGGDHAVNVAAFLATGSQYQVDFVLTAGSPTGTANLPPGVPALHLEHERDWVPGIDSVPNPDTPDRVTLTLTDPVATPEGEPAGLGPAHRLENYLDGAALADASDDGSVRTALGSLSLAVGAGQATRHLYRFEREPLPARPPARVAAPADVSTPTPPFSRLPSNR